MQPKNETPDTSQMPTGQAPDMPQQEQPVLQTGAHGGKRKALIIAVVVVVLLVIAVGISLVVNKDKPTASNNTTTPVNNSSPKTNQTDGSVAEIPTPAQKPTTALEVVAAVKSVAPGGSAMKEPGSVTAQQVKGYQYAVYAPADASLVFTKPETTAKEIQNRVNAALVSYGLKDISKNDPQYASNYFEYRGATVSCASSMYQSAVSKVAGDYDFSLTCANQATYEQFSKAIKPFFDLYAATDATTPKDGTFVMGSSQADLSGTPSKTPGYATLGLGGGSIDGGGFKMLFYKTPDGKWHFFKGTQEVLDCTAYDTLDLKKAYLGEGCIDKATGNESVVSV